MISDPIAAGLMVATGVLWLLIAVGMIVGALVDRDGWRVLTTAGAASLLVSLWAFDAASRLT